MYTIEQHPAVDKLITRMRDRELRNRLVQAIASLADNPRPNGCVKLESNYDLYRIRVGDWRIVYQIIDDRLIVLVTEVAQRKEVYRKK